MKCIYELTLTYSERMALDWVGYRYSHGDDLRHALEDCQWNPEPLDDYADVWELRQDVEFTIPEPVAWEIQKIAEDCEYQWDCFDSELASKLTRFCAEIV